MNAPLPYGWDRMLDAVRREDAAFNHHAKPLFLLVGDAPPQFGAINLRVRPGKEFSWSALTGLYVIVKPAYGVDPFPVLRSIFEFVAGWPGLLVEETGVLMSVMQLSPNFVADAYPISEAAAMRQLCDAYYSKHPIGVQRAPQTTDQLVEF